ncbi:MAG: hypothetical protein ACOC9V_06235 [Chloroflexota bacterium]
MDDIHGDGFEISTESFMVKVNIEQQAAESGALKWQGIIVHIASGDVFHFDNLHQIERVVIPYLQAHGIPFDPTER